LGDSPLATLIVLFVAGIAAPAGLATRALAPLDLQQAEALGVIGVGRSFVHPQVRIMPAPEGWFASDLEEIESPDYVMGVAESTRTLAYATIRRPVEAALDLGSGSGY